jgi:subtilisin family serine protease
MTRSGRRKSAGILAFALAAAVAVPLALLDPGAQAQPAGAAPVSSSLRWVTLLTGDRVGVPPGQLTGRLGSLVVHPAAGREKVRFVQYLDRGDSYVIPTDAATLVSSGRLDRRLFDVTKLVRYGYDDRARPDLPLIVEYTGGAVAAPNARPRLAGSGGRVERELPSIGGAAVRAPKGGAFWSTVRADLGSAGTASPRAAGSTVARVWLDAPMHATLDTSVPQIGAPTAWQRGLTGTGTTVAVLDTGLDATHPDLTDAVQASQDFTDDDVEGTNDGFGHGTHVASIVTGSGAASEGKYKGVAPDTKLLIGKVLDDFGGGFDSWIIAGMQWAADQHAKVVNMSFGSDFPGDGVDPIEQALTRLTANGGPLFVVAAGNSGPIDESIGSPAEVPAALTVGAVDKQDHLADFSSRGPASPDGSIKPDITAPGVGIVAAKAKDGIIGDPVGHSYVSLDGTSMATPHVAGAAAILAGEHPDWTAEQLKDALVGSATPGTGITVDQQGAGRVNVASAIDQTAYATPANVSLGIARWPHNDDPVINKTITYHNAGSAPATLDLALAMTGANGAAAPAGLFALSASRLTIPAGGSADVRITATTNGPAPDGRYTGILTATGAGGPVRTPVSLVKEVESYDVPVTAVDRAGKLTPNYGFRFVDVDHPKAFFPYDPSGRVTARLPKGRYYFEGDVQTKIGSGEFDFDFTNVIEPNFVVSGPGAKITMDPRRGKPIGLSVQRRATMLQATYSSVLETAFGGTGSFTFAQNFDGQFAVPSKTAAPAGKYNFTVQAWLTGPRTGQAPPQYFYQAGWQQPDRVPAQLNRALPDSGMAVVKSRFGGPTPGRLGFVEGILDVRLPATTTKLVSPIPQAEFLFTTPPDGDLETVQFASTRDFGTAKTTETWNLPVFGPALPEEPGFVQFAGRFGDEILFAPSLFADQTFNHAGDSIYDAGVSRLFKGDQLIGESPLAANGDFRVPADDAVYRYETEAVRSRPAPLSSKVSLSWTFHSGHVDGPQVRPLPLAVVRFAPVVDDQGRPKAGQRLLPVPVFLQREAEGGFGQLTNMSVQASFDDGASWLPVSLSGSGDRRVAMVRQPTGTGFVSLRATATDRAGNAVTQTIIRAYVLR